MFLLSNYKLVLFKMLQDVFWHSLHAQQSEDQFLLMDTPYQVLSICMHQVYDMVELLRVLHYEESE